MGRSRTGFAANRGALNPPQIAKYIIKSASQVKNNSTSFSDDTHLFIVFPNRASVYDIELVAFVTGPDAANFKSTWVGSGGLTASSYRNCLGATANASFSIYDTQMQNRAEALSGIVDYGTNPPYVTCIREKFLVSTTSAMSKLQWQWAQNTATASDTTVLISSYIIAQEIRLFS